jgi:hypothetical protein
MRKMMTLRVFEDRVECTQPGLVGSGSTDSVRYDQIAQVFIDRGLRWSRLAIQTTGGGGFGIAGINKNEAETAKALIEERIARSRTSGPAPAVAPSIADQITQLAALHDSGALSDEEFAAAKARLLSATS